jgi:hypothetical protein
MNCTGVEWYWQWNTEVLGKSAVPVSFFSQQTQHKLVWDETGISMVKDRPLSLWAVPWNWICAYKPLGRLHIPIQNLGWFNSSHTIQDIYFAWNRGSLHSNFFSVRKDQWKNIILAFQKLKLCTYCIQEYNLHVFLGIHILLTDKWRILCTGL